MKIFKSDTPLSEIEKSVVSVGNFDGLHIGHQRLIKKLVERAQKLDACSILITFDPHTRSFFKPTKILNCLTTLKEKAFILDRYNIDYLVCIHFDKYLAAMSPEDFIKHILIERYRAVEWVMGKNHTFGRNKKGNHNFLHKFGGINHFNTVSVDLNADYSSIISSTRIRNLCDQSHVDEAVMLLGHPYLVIAERIRGKKKGSELGYPTLNFKCPPSNKAIPPPGVYAAEVEFGDKKIAGALYFGNCPTFGDRDYHFEFYSLDKLTIEPEIDKDAALWMHSFIRYDKLFSSEDLLVEQIKKDVISIKQFFHKE